MFINVYDFILKTSYNFTRQRSTLENGSQFLLRCLVHIKTRIKMKSVFAVIILATAILMVNSSSVTEPCEEVIEKVTISTKNGVIEGNRKIIEVQVASGHPVKTEPRTVDVFKGIPYAQPPVGDLRYKPPVKASKWSGKKKALEWPNSCPQHIPRKSLGLPFTVDNVGRMSEDCLYLNVWVPKKGTRKRPVVVYFYGGVFSMGTTRILNFGYFSACQNVIVVSINYRIGMFGFPYFGNPEYPPNVGIMDQQMALKWVQRNIDIFGGDPDRVTLMGHGAGSVSVGYHLLNSESNPLFHRAIMGSGVPISAWASDSPDDAKKKTMKVVDAMGCTSKNIKNTMSCLSKIMGVKIADKSAELMDHPLTRSHLPVRDNKYVTSDIATVADKLKNLAHVRNKTVMLGVNSHDGGMLVRACKNKYRLNSRDIFLEFLKRCLHLQGSKHVWKTIRYFYNDHCKKFPDWVEERAAVRVSTDYGFTNDVQRFADELVQAGVETYMCRLLVTLSVQKKKEKNGIESSHGALDIFIGHTDLLDGEEERELAFKIITYLGNFIKNGDPNARSDDDEIDLETWPPYTPSKRQRLDIGLTCSTVVHGQIDPNTSLLWDFLYPKMTKAK